MLAVSEDKKNKKYKTFTSDYVGGCEKHKIQLQSHQRKNFHHDTMGKADFARSQQEGGGEQ